MSDKKLAVIFPGVGYHTDKPLLYYSKKIAKQHGYDIVELSFHDIDKDALLAGGRPDTLTQPDRKKMLEAFQTVTTEAEEQLRSTDFAGYRDIIFISKSIGTVAASVYAAREKVAARQVYFTPLEQTFSLIGEKNGLVFFGTEDPFVDVGKIEELSRAKGLSYRIFEGANHSLETGELQTDLKNMVDIMEETENFLVGSPVYRIPVQKRDGSISDLSEYRGKVLLIINSATGCGFTPQYEALEAIYRRCRERGFEILDFPCDQFGHQAPGSNEEIHSFCTSRYDISFPQFSKIDVNGENGSELFAYLKQKQGFRGFLRNTKESMYMEKLVAKMDPDYQHNSDIKWNFTKFLVNKRGQVTDRFEPDAGTDIVGQAVERELL